MSAEPEASSSSAAPEPTDIPFDDHLSYPTFEPKEAAPPPSVTNAPRELNKRRLYVGNLHTSVDEYTLLQLFMKYGKVSKMDYIFHKSGPMKGKPRGYAFIEYTEQSDAFKAMVGAHDKLLRGRKLSVTFAHQAPPSDGGFTGTRRGFSANEANRPTALSLLKSASQSGRTRDKIAAMEAKLRELGGKQGSGSFAASSSSTSLPFHPSLPLRPPEEQIIPSIAPTASSVPEEADSASTPENSSTPTLQPVSKAPTPASSSPGNKSPRSSSNPRSAMFSNLEKPKSSSLLSSGNKPKAKPGKQGPSPISQLGKKPSLAELMRQRGYGGGKSAGSTGLLGKR